MKNKTLYFAACLILISLTSGCIMTKKTGQWAPVQQAQRSFVHIVKWPDENLAIISSWYTGSEGNEEKLADNNPNINPKQLIIGDRVFIPNDLLVRRDPMTEDFMEQSFSRPKETEKTESEPIIPEEIEKTEPEPPIETEKVEKKVSKPVVKPENTEKKKVEYEKKETEKKKPAPEPEEEDFNLFGPK